MTPPVVTIPVVTIPVQSDRTVVSMESHSQPNVPFINNSAETLFAVLDHRKKELSLIWLLGSVFVFALSLVRVYRFNSLLRKESEVAPQELQTLAARIANRLSLKTVPTIYTTSAHLSPMVWWIGGKVRVVIPAALPDQMDTRQFQWILAHELAHVRRRDYLVRWIEWLACVCFWWNPVVWWARYNLRANEELCCDALVVSSLKPKPQTYADSLLKAVEYLACPVHRLPAMASEINSGGSLERRFKMIVSDKLYRSSSRWLQACVLLCALVVLPLSFACQKDAVTEPAELTEEANLNIAADPARVPDYEAVAARIRAAVEAGEITEEDARARLGAYRNRIGQRVRGEDQSVRGEDLRAEYEAVAVQLRAAVEAGEMTEEQGAARLYAYRKSLGERVRGEDQRAMYGAVAARIRAAVEAGEMTEEDGRARLEAYRKSLGRKKEIVPVKK